MAPPAMQTAAQAAIARHRAIIQVLEDAQSSGNMTGAIERYGTSLTAAEKSILLGISPGELAALRSARSKLNLRPSP